MFVKVKKVNENAILPKRATTFSAGADLYACLENDVEVFPGKRILIPTGIALAIPNNFGGFVFPRSSTASKFGISLSNCVGVIDSDYRGEVFIPIINNGEAPYTIRSGDRIAQLVILPVQLAEFQECFSLDDTERSDGGFGSTGSR